MYIDHNDELITEQHLGYTYIRKATLDDKLKYYKYIHDNNIHLTSYGNRIDGYLQKEINK